MTRSRVAVLIGLTALYYVTGKLGLSLALDHPSATAIWPPSGISLAGLLLLGYSAWPGIFLGALLVNITTAGSIGTSLGIATGNTLEGLVGAFLMNRFARGCDAFERPVDTFRFALAVAFSTMISPLMGATSLALGGYASWEHYGTIWLTWYFGDLAGALTMAPLLILWTRNPRLLNRRRSLEALVLIAGLIVAGQVVFGGVLAGAPHDYSLSFVPAPLLVWVAVRFGPRETVTMMVLLTAMAVWGTLHGFGPFARLPPNQALLLLQAFLGILAVMSLTLAAGVAEQQRTEARLRKREEEMRASESELRTLFASMTDVVLVLDRQGRYVKIAPTKPSFLYRPREELLGKTVHDVLPTDQADPILKHIHDALASSEPIRVEYTLSIRDANVWFDGTVARLTSETVLWVARDITARKQAELQLHQLTQALERRVDERTASLKAAHDQLQELYALKSAFVSIVSHELRTPMTSIKGFIENMLQGLTGPLRERQSYYLSRVKYNVDRLTRMLNELLDLSQIEAGRVTLRPEQTCVGELMAEILDGFGDVIREKGIVLEGPGPVPLPAVTCDRDKVQQILTNLLENAVKFTPIGGTVRVEARLLEDRFLQICVSDTGCGIPREELSRVFDRFYRCRATPTEVAGTGLGLAIAKSFVELHGGAIWAESDPDQGSRFYFTLPSAHSDVRSPHS